MSNARDSLKVVRVIEKDYAGLKHFLDYVIRQDSLGIPPKPKVLNIGGINSQENEALYNSFDRPVIDVMDVDKEFLESLAGDFINKKIHTNAANMPALYLNGMKYDVIFSRHPPVINWESDLTRVDKENAPAKKVNIWDIVLKQMHFGNPGGLTLMTFYNEKEYKHALGNLAKHKPLKHGKNPCKTVFSKLESRILFEAGKANKKDVVVIRDNYYLLSRNTCAAPDIKSGISLFLDKDDSLVSEFGDKVLSYFRR